MMKMLYDQASPDQHIVSVFANTGQEDERTLVFVDKCSRYWGIPVVWVEAAVNPKKGQGTTHKIVDFQSACRDPSIFEAVISKYGIPGRNYPHCTRELKLHPLTSYIRSIGWNKGTYVSAIGIRADEMDRMNPNFDAHGLVYPLIKAKIKKSDVFEFWDKQAFDLRVPEHRGNCTWCWKKSLRKHLTLAREEPELYDFAQRMEAAHAFTNQNPEKGPRTFFRERRTAADIVEMSKHDFEAFVDQRYLDQGGSCEESCEVYSSEEQ